MQEFLGCGIKMGNSLTCDSEGLVTDMNYMEQETWS